MTNLLYPQCTYTERNATVVNVSLQDTLLLALLQEIMGIPPVDHVYVCELRKLL